MNSNLIKKAIIMALIFFGVNFLICVNCAPLLLAEEDSKDISLSGKEVVIIRLKGNVKVLKKGQDSWQNATQNMQLLEGDSLKTGRWGSYAEICFNYNEEKEKKKNIVKVLSGTTITLNTVEPTKTQVELDKGELYCLMEKLKEGSTFEVRTPTAICGSRGTGWQIKYNPKTLILCYENAVYVQPLDEEGNPTGEGYILEEGYKKVIGLLEIEATQRLSDQEKRKWNSWRRDLGQFLDAYIIDTGPTADAYTPPPASGTDIDTDTGDLNREDDDLQGNDRRGAGNPDSDGDGVLDSDDLYPNNPNRASGNDRDGDGIDDEFDPNDNDGPLGDLDGDGLNNNDELAGNTPFNYITNPNKADTDDDGALDGPGTDRFPLDRTEQLDSDNDVPTYWNLLDRGPEVSNLFMPDELYPGDNEDAFADDPDIHGLRIYRDINGDLTNNVAEAVGDPIAYGWIVENDDGEQVIVRGYGSRFEIQREFAAMIEDAADRLDEMDKNDLYNDVNAFINDIQNRQKDARLDQAADAKMHKVMTDIHGNRVRIEQYVLRPSEKSIQLLNVNLRTGDTPLKGLTTLNWTATFNRNIVKNEIHKLPWEDYLTVRGDGDIFRITSPDTIYYQVPNSNPNCAYPLEMMIELTHNADSIYEKTTFGVHEIKVTNYWQDVTDYCFNVNDLNYFQGVAGLKAFRDNTLSRAGNPATFVTALTYTDDDPSWTQVNTIMETRTQTRDVSQALVGAFHVINDQAQLTGQNVEIASLMDMLRVGYLDLANGSNLEAIFDFLAPDGYERTRLQTRWFGDDDMITSGDWVPVGTTNGPSEFASPLDIILVPVEDPNWQPDEDWSWWD